MTHPSNSGFNPNKVFTKEIYSSYRQGIIDGQDSNSLKDGIESKVVMKIRELLSNGQKKEAADLMISITEDIIDKNETGYDKKLLVELYKAVNELSPYLFTKDMGDRILNYLSNSDGPEADKLKESLKCLVKHGLYDREWVTKYASSVKSSPAANSALIAKISSIDKDLSKTTITESGLERINSIRSRCLEGPPNIENIHVVINERFYEDYRRLKETNVGDSQIQERLTNSIAHTLNDVTSRLGKASAARCMVEIHQTIKHLNNTNTFNSELLQKIMDRLNSEDSRINSFDVGMSMIKTLVDPSISSKTKQETRERLEALVRLGYFPLDQIQKEAIKNNSQELFNTHTALSSKSQSSKASQRLEKLQSILPSNVSSSSSTRANTISLSSNESISSRSSLETREKGPALNINPSSRGAFQSEKKAASSSIDENIRRLENMPLAELKNLAKRTYSELDLNKKREIGDAIQSSLLHKSPATLSYSIGAAANTIGQPVFKILYRRLIEEEIRANFNRATNEELVSGTQAFASILQIKLK